MTAEFGRGNWQKQGGQHERSSSFRHRGHSFDLDLFHSVEETMNALQKKSRELKNSLPPERTGTPPPMKGQLLGALPHKEGSIRIVWDEYEGHSYLSIRLWTADDNGQLWPSKNGFTVRVKDLPALGEAVGKALDMALTTTQRNTTEPDRYARSREGIGAPF